MGKEDQGDKEGLQNLLEEAEILAELKEEERVRKKNAKILSMAVIGVIICGAVFFLSRNVPPEKPPVGNEPPPPRNEELYPEAGKIKSPGGPLREMKALDAPLESEDDIPAIPKPGAGPGKQPPKSAKLPPQAVKEAAKKPAGGKKTGTYTIRVGVCVLDAEVKRAKDQISSLGLLASSRREKNKVKMHKVLVGPYKTREKAVRVRNRLQALHVRGNLTTFEGGYYIRVGAFYKKEGALRMKDRVKKMGYFSRPLFQPTKILSHTLYATGHGDPAAAREKVNLLRKQGFKTAAVTRP